MGAVLSKKWPFIERCALLRLPGGIILTQANSAHSHTVLKEHHVMERDVANEFQRPF